MITQLQEIRSILSKNAERGSQNEFAEKWALDMAQRLDALIDNLVASQSHSRNLDEVDKRQTERGENDLKRLMDDRQEQEEQRMTILDDFDREYQERKELGLL